MTTLINLMADAPALRVMQTAGRITMDIGDAERHFRSRLALIQVGAKQNTDASRGAYEWYPLTIDGKTVGELRDDATGTTIHVPEA